MVRLLVELVLILVALWWLQGAVRRMISPGGSGQASAALEKGARWETHTESGGGQTSVVVRRVATTGVVLGRQVVAAIPDSAPDWELRYHEAMAEARSRLAALRAQS